MASAASASSGKEESSSSPNISTKKDHPGASSGINTFANDGSFLELFKKRMKEESQKQRATEPSVREDEGEKKVDVDCEEKQSDRKAVGPTKSITQQVWFSEKENAKIFPFCWER